MPASEQFQDIYHSESGALAQAHHVFMAGCGLPARWQRRRSFTIVETGFGLGLNFLATWQAWLDDPARCERLHFVSIEAYPVCATDLQHAIARAPGLDDHPHIRQLAAALAARYPKAPHAGIHRLRFPHPHDARHTVVLSLVVGDAVRWLPQLRLQADAAYFDGFSPARNPELWQPRVFKGVARLLKPHAWAATWTIAASVRKGLVEAGFLLQRRPGLPPKRDALQARFVPWALRSHVDAAADPEHLQSDNPIGETSDSHTAPRHALVIGAGIAGAASCWSLAQRGWQVTLIDSAETTAAGASGLPAGLAVPHLSPDDAVISRLTRAGVEWMRQILTDSAAPRQTWCETPVWQVLVDTADDDISASASDRPDPPLPSPTPARLTSLGGQTVEPQAELAGGYSGPAVEHPQGLLIQGRELVAHWLSQCPGLILHTGKKVARLQRLEESGAGSWLAFDDNGKQLARADVVIVATAMATQQLIDLQPPHEHERPDRHSDDPLDTGSEQANSLLTPLRGQITLGRWTDGASHTLPLTGHGHFIANWSKPGSTDRSDKLDAADVKAGAAHWDWSMGSSFERGETTLSPQPSSDLQNLHKLRTLAPQLADALHKQFAVSDHDGPACEPWVQIRATTADRLPLAGPIADWQAAATAARAANKPLSTWTLDNLPRQPGLYTLCGLGARGLSLAALCAELLACQIEGEPSPIDAGLAQAIDPARFALRHWRRPERDSRRQPS